MVGRPLLNRLLCWGNKLPRATGELAPPLMIRSIRNALRMTQADLARRAGLPQSHLAKIESGRVDIQLSTLRRILRAMFCELVVLPRFQKSPREALAERLKELARLKARRVKGGFDAPVRIVEKEDPRADLRYWLGKTPAERVSAVEFLREQFYALSGYKARPRLIRDLRVVSPPA